ncbi:hypothetical protein Anapl_05906 [Anas platyrhynchos]|uniref:Uncharacterized protein n=1 Tax=Anas platyrhynchos TaxID=8839 RepID=R0LK14_ANAPL|nr:hypothetical protein Anapl_05906 [Anas platyrhynchos]
MGKCCQPEMYLDYQQKRGLDFKKNGSDMKVILTKPIFLQIGDQSLQALHSTSTIIVGLPSYKKDKILTVKGEGVKDHAAFQTALSHVCYLPPHASDAALPPDGSTYLSSEAKEMGMISLNMKCRIKSVDLSANSKVELQDAFPLQSIKKKTADSQKQPEQPLRVCPSLSQSRTDHFQPQLTLTLLSQNVDLDVPQMTRLKLRDLFLKHSVQTAHTSFHDKRKMLATVQKKEQRTSRCLLLKITSAKSTVPMLRTSPHHRTSVIPSLQHLDKVCKALLYKTALLAQGNAKVPMPPISAVADFPRGSHCSYLYDSKLLFVFYSSISIGVLEEEVVQDNNKAKQHSHQGHLFLSLEKLYFGFPVPSVPQIFPEAQPQSMTLQPDGYAHEYTGTTTVKLAFKDKDFRVKQEEQCLGNKAFFQTCDTDTAALPCWLGFEVAVFIPEMKTIYLISLPVIPS